MQEEHCVHGSRHAVVPVSNDAIWAVKRGTTLGASHGSGDTSGAQIQRLRLLRRPSSSRSRFSDTLEILASSSFISFTYLGLMVSAGWYRRFVKNFATLAVPLSESSKKGGSTKFSLSPSTTQTVDDERAGPGSCGFLETFIHQVRRILL